MQVSKTHVRLWSRQAPRLSFQAGPSLHSSTHVICHVIPHSAADLEYYCSGKIYSTSELPQKHPHPGNGTILELMAIMTLHLHTVTDPRLSVGTTSSAGIFTIMDDHGEDQSKW